MRRHLAGIAVATALAGLAGAPGAARAQQKEPLTLALYAPSIPFKGTEARLVYVRLLAEAIAGNLGRRVEPRLYGSMSQLRKARPDLAIVEPQCALSGSWRPVATAKIGGKSSRHWALFGVQGATVAGLRGKRLAYAASGCEDKDFLEHVLFQSEVRLRYFRDTEGKVSVGGAVAEVASVKAAQAVFAPADQGAGLTKLFDAGEIPNPVLVVDARTSGGVASSIETVAQKFGSSGAIDGWVAVDRRAQADLERRMKGMPKHFVLADAPAARLPVKTMVDLPSRRDAALVSVKRYLDVGDVSRVAERN